jgi:hypothetical protein
MSRCRNIQIISAPVQSGIPSPICLRLPAIVCPMKRFGNGEYGIIPQLMENIAYA